ncbi:phage morphogenesis protein [Chryseobacterium sp. T1]
MAGFDELGRTLGKIVNVFTKQLPIIIEVEGLNFIKKNFQEESFDDGAKRAWQKRKTTDVNGKDLTRYRTSRVGSKGSLTQFGRREQGRALLTGHNTGGDKLRNSFRARRSKLSVIFYTYKEYAERHNEGFDHTPKRQFMGKSKTLENKITTKLTKTLDKAVNS